MRHMTIAFFYPNEENTKQFMEGCEKIAEVVRTQPGLVETGAWLDSEQNRIVIMSLWESEEAAIGSRPKMGSVIASLPFREWERKPPEQLSNLTRVA